MRVVGLDVLVFDLGVVGVEVGDHVQAYHVCET